MDYPGKVITKNQVTPSQTSASGVWTVDDAAAAVENNSWPVAGVPNPISRSLRFNSGDTPSLSRTFAAGNRKTFTASVWAKLTAFGGTGFRPFLSCTNSGGTKDEYFILGTNADQYVWIYSRTGGVDYYARTSAVFRDPSAWYHLVFAIDTTQATNTDRFKIYINGELATIGLSVYPPQNYDLPYVNVNGKVGYIGPYFDGAQGTFYLNAYLTEYHFIDGQALDPTYFGMTDPQTGAWIPKAYNGTYGTNGFYLNFSDNASTAALGTDYSGNSNTWTTNNFSVTAGAGNDSLTDVPTPWIAYNTTGDVGGVVRGNYCTLNPLNIPTGGSIANGNLDYTAPSAEGQVVGTIYVSSGKYYWEMVKTSSGGGAFGIAKDTTNINSITLNAGSYVYYTDGDKYDAGVGSSYGATYTTNDVIGVALDLDAGTLAFYKNGVSQGTAFTGLSGNFAPLIFDGTSASTQTATANFGQRPFAYTPPAGFLSLCTTNLPTPDILNGEEYFNPVLYTGTGSTNSITGVGFQPDLVWLKSRSNANDNNLYDSVRGISGTGSPTLLSNLTDAETTYTGFGVSSLNSDGFTVIGNGGLSNGSGLTYVGWNWKAGGTPAVTNTDGTITSSISVNTTSGFSIVTYTGNLTSGATVGHGLGVAPAMVIQKNRITTDEPWFVYHTSVGATQFLRLNATDAAATNSSIWNNTAPTSTVVTLGNNPGINGSSQGCLLYCFAAVPGFSAFGKYTGNGSTDGPFAYTGFRPRYVMIKRTDVANSWVINDAARNPYNVIGEYLSADQSYAGSDFTAIDFTSNGFKIRTTSNAWNASGGTLIYMAFAENPFKYSNAR